MGNKNLAIDSTLLETLNNYFEVIHAQDLELFDQVFHHSCTLYSAQGGELVLRPYQVYRDQVAGRQSPKQLGNPRKDEVLEVDQISETMAWAKVQLQMFGGVMQDYLNLVKIDGKWWVIAKLYEKVSEY